MNATSYQDLRRFMREAALIWRRKSTKAGIRDEALSRAIFFREAARIHLAKWGAPNHVKVEWKKGRCYWIGILQQSG